MDARKRLRHSRSAYTISKPSATSKNALGASSSSGSVAAPKKATCGSLVALVACGAGKRKSWDLQGRLKDLEQLVNTLSGDKHQLQLPTQEQTGQGNIRVFCWVRPMLPSEEREGDRQSRLSFPDDKTVELVRPDSEKVMVFPFDRMFPSTATQGQVYEEVAHVAQSALDGYNVCIFAYGQTGSGKTFTMEGPPDLDLSSPDDAQLGLIPRALQQVFLSEQELQRSHHWQFTMAATFVEIYNEKVCYLLSTCPRTKQDTDGSITRTIVTSPEQIFTMPRKREWTRDG